MTSSSLRIQYKQNDGKIEVKRGAKYWKVDEQIKVEVKTHRLRADDWAYSRWYIIRDGRCLYNLICLH